MSLDNNAGEGAWFKIMPRLRVHSEGEKIRVDDPVVLENVDTHLKLCSDPQLGSVSSHQEVT